jgi:hypothetical protein
MLRCDEVEVPELVIQVKKILVEGQCYYCLRV